MNYYLIIYTNGNGYHCNCCRQEFMSTEILEFEDDNKAREYKQSYNTPIQKNKCYDDSNITNIYRLADENPID